jgi:flagellar basal body-associated protein FliL
MDKIYVMRNSLLETLSQKNKEMLMQDSMLNENALNNLSQLLGLDNISDFRFARINRVSERLSSE